jgi:xylulose-5-phosphate/fructose-6-phosphate phosphoketolase
MANPQPFDAQLDLLHEYWCAANYLCVGQIYLRDNPLLREPLRAEHIKPRLLGHWGTCPGLNLIYAHMNRLIRENDVDAIYLTDGAGMQELFRQFSSPGGVPSHVSVPTPGSIHEGGELGYVLSHAFGAAFDHPQLLVVAVVGDGEAETGPLQGAWPGIRFLNPKRDGAVLPILHLNGPRSWAVRPTITCRCSSSRTATRCTSWKGTTRCRCTARSRLRSTLAGCVSAPCRPRRGAAAHLPPSASVGCAGR